MVSLSNKKKKKSCFPQESRTLKVYFLEMTLSRPALGSVLSLPASALPPELHLVAPVGSWVTVAHGSGQVVPLDGTLCLALFTPRAKLDSENMGLGEVLGLLLPHRRGKCGPECREWLRRDQTPARITSLPLEAAAGVRRLRDISCPQPWAAPPCVVCTALPKTTFPLLK